MELHYVANDNERRRLEFFYYRQHGQRFQRPDDHALLRGGALLHDRRRRRGGKPVRREFAAQDRQTEQSHIDNYRLVAPRQSFPVQIHAAVLKVAGHEDAGVGVIPMR